MSQQGAERLRCQPRNDFQMASSGKHVETREFFHVPTQLLQNREIAEQGLRVAGAVDNRFARNLRDEIQARAHTRSGRVDHDEIETLLGRGPVPY